MTSGDDRREEYGADTVHHCHYSPRNNVSAATFVRLRRHNADSIALSNEWLSSRSGDSLSAAGCHALAHFLHLLAIRTVQSRRRTSGHPTQENKLRTMMNEVMKQLIPEDLTDRELAAIKESHDAIELIVPDIVESCQSLVMDSTISGSE